MPVEDFRIQGMTCSACVRHVERALKDVKGVEQVQVNLATHSCRIIGSASPKELAAAVSEAGYELLPSREKQPEEGTSPSWATLRLVLAWVLTLPLMLSMWPRFHLPPWMQAMLATMVVAGAGWPFLHRAWNQFLHKSSSMDTLVSLGSLSALLFGYAEWISGAHHLSFETAAALISFLLTGKYLEHRALIRTRSGLEALQDLVPRTALKWTGQDFQEVDTGSLLEGDRVRVRPGQAVPVDGIVHEGLAEVDESLLTGEALPLLKAPGDPVWAGSILHGTSLEIQVKAAGSQTQMACIARWVEEAQASQAPIQTLADRVSAYFVPSILVLALITWIAWLLGTRHWETAWRPAVTVLVIACPCALGLATPVALAAALGRAAQLGILARSASAWDALARLTDMAFDKTGTLTLGRPKLLRIEAQQAGVSEILGWAASLEQHSEHPVAKGIRDAAAEAGISCAPVKDFITYPGQGVEGWVDGTRVQLGTAAYLGHPLASVGDFELVVGLVKDGEFQGSLVLGDELRPETPQVLTQLQKEGLELYLLSGDRPDSALAIGQKAGIQNIHGGLSPQDKAQILQKLQAQGRKVGFAGDGINDAPALAQADCGLALGVLEAAQSAAGLMILKSGLEPLLQARSLARRTLRIVRQNLGWAFAYNLILVPLAATGQLERFGGPMLAGLAMGLSSLTVVLNALRLTRKREMKPSEERD